MKKLLILVPCILALFAFIYALSTSAYNANQDKHLAYILIKSTDGQQIITTKLIDKAYAIGDTVEMPGTATVTVYSLR